MGQDARRRCFGMGNYHSTVKYTVVLMIVLIINTMG
jgi:hypothetical protein